MFEIEIIFESAILQSLPSKFEKAVSTFFSIYIFMSENRAYEPVCASQRTSPSKGTDTIEKIILPERRRFQPTPRPKNRQIMDREVAWTAAECADFARAWVEESEDPTLVIEQTSHHFITGMFHRFKSMIPIEANQKQYAGRGFRPERAKWDAIESDCQKFRSDFCFIRAKNSTAVTEDQIISMEIVKHLGKIDSMSYDALEFSHERWKKFRAYRILGSVPKFREE